MSSYTVFKMNEYTLRGSNCVILILSSFSVGVSSKARICSHISRFLPHRVDCIVKRLFYAGKQSGCHKSYSPFIKLAEKYESVIIHLNPIALRKAKIVYNFGLSECNRVNQVYCYSVSFR